MDELNYDNKMYVRFIGCKVCWTFPNTSFYMGEIDEATEEELALCKDGGGYLPINEHIQLAAAFSEG